MPDILIVGDTERSLRAAPRDPGRTSATRSSTPRSTGARVAVVWSVEGDRIAAVDPTIEIVPVETFSPDDLIRDGVDYLRARADASRCAWSRSLGLTRRGRARRRFRSGTPTRSGTTASS